VNEALALRELQFKYGSRAAVRGVSLQLQAGDCYGFLGHNGAGKTTVMRLCLGLLRPSHGSVRIFGIDPGQERRRANSLVGALIERPGFHLHVSARQNLVALARLQGIAKHLAKVEVGRVIECVGLNDAIDRKVGTFSMGMRQRLGIAQALLGKPRLLFLDEPTNGLDPEGIADLRALLHRLTREEGTAIMLSSHQLAELDGLCNRVGVLREGSMVIEGDLDSLRRRVGVRHVITGEPIAEMQRELEGMNLEPSRDGDRLFVNLGERKADDVTRALATKTKLASFAPEQATLERIYLHAASADADQQESAAPTSEAAPPRVRVRVDDAAAQAFDVALDVAAMRRRCARGHELRQTRWRRPEEGRSWRTVQCRCWQRLPRRRAEHANGDTGAGTRDAVAR
jgi:ABC-2 type transport system ATP-binding protein